MKSPSELARETLKILAQRRLAPTPDNYAKIFNEISGTPADEDNGAEKVLRNMAEHLLLNDKSAATGIALKKMLTAEKWEQYYKEIEKVLPKAQSEDSEVQSWASMIRDLLRQLEMPHKGLTISRKKEGLDTVLSRFSSKPDVLFDKLEKLVRSWSETPTASLIETDPTESVTETTGAAPARGMSGGTPSQGDVPSAILARGMSGGYPSQGDDPSATPARGMSGGYPSQGDDPSATPARGISGGSPSQGDDPSAILIQITELLAKSLEASIDTQPELTDEVQRLGTQVRATRTLAQATELADKLRQFWLKVELHNTDKTKIQEGLVRLLRLLVANVSEMVEDEEWLHGQIHTLHDIIDNPLDNHVIADAERSLRDAIIKQGLLKTSLDDTKSTLKNLMTTFIDRLSVITTSTGEYHQKIDSYSQKIAHSDNLHELGHLLDDIMQDTRDIQDSTLRSHEELLDARKQVENAEAKISQLEKELFEVSELVQQDQLTGALNRRGMDATFEREVKNTGRNQSPLCVALLDIDNFKQLNDTLGHQVGDHALVHLCNVIKEALRPSDSVARYGGEEFVIILPDVDLEEAASTVERLQRELTKKFFMNGNDRVLVTFSSGVAQHKEHETQREVIGRADKAMYQAKRSGKNRVVIAR